MAAVTRLDTVKPEVPEVAEFDADMEDEFDEDAATDADSASECAA